MMKNIIRIAILLCILFLGLKISLQAQNISAIPFNLDAGISMSSDLLISKQNSNPILNNQNSNQQNSNPVRVNSKSNKNNKICNSQYVLIYKVSVPNMPPRAYKGCYYNYSLSPFSYGLKSKKLN